MKKTGSLFVIAAPSGAGKTSLIAALLQKVDSIQLSVSHTTRSPREGEVDGEHYHFSQQADFQKMIQNESFLEYAQVFDNYYGTSRQALEQQLATGKDVILEIDWQGARQVKKLMSDCVGIFILPPSKQALHERLTGRGQDNEQIISRRMAGAVSEMSHYGEFDYLIINDNFEQALQELEVVITAQNYRMALQKLNLGNKLTELVAK
ncbi:Guanylate kinase [hydrothermal vent metagenome]|uniref:guanylate kinase n=1 Tax=hydrothermal vent metagenome TaxID=652676 RepID=A0A3B1A7F4_9ZZZZ